MQQYPVVTSGLGEQSGMVPVADGAGNFTWQSISSVVQGISSPAGAAFEDLLVYNGSSWARLPVGGTDQVMVVRADGTIGYETPTAISARAWNVRPTNGSATNTANMQAAINQATENTGQGPGGTAAGGTIDIAAGNYWFNAALLWKFGVKTRTPGRYAVTFSADGNAPLSNFQNGSRTDSTGAKVPALIRWDGGDQWAHGVHIKGIEFVVNTVPGLSAWWFQSTGETSIFDDCGCSNATAVSRTVQNAQLVAGSNSVTLTQVPTLVSSTAVGGASPLTSAAINTTGATLLVVTIGSSSTAPTVTDNMGNAWTVVGSSVAWIAYAWQKSAGVPLATGSAHTVTVATTSSPNIYFAAYSGTKTSADPVGTKHTSSTTGGTAASAGSITPPEAYDLLVSVANGNNVLGATTIDSGFTMVNSSDLVGGVRYANFTATKVPTNAAATNPVWTTTNAPGTAVTMISASPGTVVDTFTQEDVNAVLTMGLVGSPLAAIAAPAAPAVALAAGGTLPTGTVHQVAVRYQTANGEGPVSAQSSITPTSGNQTITVTSPVAASGATGYVVYMDAGAGLRRQSGVLAIGTNFSQSIPTTLTNPNPYDKIDRIDWPVNSTAQTNQTMIMRNAAVATLSNVSMIVARPTDAFIFDGGGVAGRIGSLNGVKNSGALLRLKNQAGCFEIDELSGDDNVGGMLRCSLLESAANPGSIHIGAIKAETDVYDQPWPWAMDPVILLDRCAQVAIKIDGGSFVGNIYCRDVVRSDNPIGAWDWYGASNQTPFVGGPSVKLSGVEGQNWFNPPYTNIMRDTFTGEAIPVAPFASRAYPDILWSRDIRLAGGAAITDAGSPLQHGGVGDNIHDDTAAVQAAITASQAGGPKVLIDRPYLIHGQLTYDLGKPLHMEFKGPGKLTWPAGYDLGIPAPTNVTAVAQAGTTSFSAQTNYYRVTAFNAYGEGIASAEVNVAITAGQQVALAWNAVAGATSYRVYRGTAAYGESVYYSLGNVTAFTDTNAATSGTAHPPRNGRIYGIQGTGSYVDGTYPVFSRARLIGPGGTLSSSAGVRPALMHGLQLGPKANLQDNWFITGFNAGYAFNGDHQRVFGGASRGNYIGELWGADPWNGQIGDQLVEGVELTNNALASVYVSPASNELYNVRHSRSHFGFGPFGIYLEGQGVAADAMSQCVFDNCYFESISTSHVYSESANNNITRSAFRNCPGYFQGAPLAGYTAGWNMNNVGVIQDLTIDSSDAFATPGSAGVISCSIIYRLEWFNGQGVIDSLAAGTKPLLQALYAEDFFIWGKGRNQVLAADTSTLRGDVMQLKTSSPLSGNGIWATRYVAGQSGQQAPILGVALQQCPNVQYQTFVPVCIEGRCSIRTVLGVTAGQYLALDTVNNGAVMGAGLPSMGNMGKALATAAANTLAESQFYLTHVGLTQMVIAAATQLLASRLAQGDANPAFQIGGDGKISWGAGGATALDTDLYRSAAGVLKSDGSLTLVGNLSTIIASGGTMLSNKFAAADANNAFQIGSSGRMQWGAGGASAWDTDLYRQAAGQLRTDGGLLLGTTTTAPGNGGVRGSGVFVANDGAGSEVAIGFDALTFGAGPALCFTNALDTTIRRKSANIVQIDNQLQLKRATPVYSASITPDASGGPWQTITVTDANILTLNAPTNPPDANHTGVLTMEVFNNTAAAMGAITWNVIFLFAGFVWANPAAGKKRFARFEWNGANWICTSMAAADY